MLFNKVQRCYPPIRITLAYSASLMGKLATSRSYSTTSSSPDDKIWLLLPSSEAKRNDDGPSKVHIWNDYCFYDIRNEQFLTSSNLQQQKRDPCHESCEPYIVGSSHGFVARLNPQDCSLSLVKVPSKFDDASASLESQSYDLPCIDTLPDVSYKLFRESKYNHKHGEFRIDAFVVQNVLGKMRYYPSKKVADSLVGKIVTSDPRLGDSPTVVMSTAIPTPFGFMGKTRVAFCQGCDAKKWIKLDSDGYIADVIYCHRDDEFYGILNSSDFRSHPDFEIHVWDLKDPAFPKQRKHTPRLNAKKFSNYFHFEQSKMKKSRGSCKNYLVESMGDILVVVRRFAYHVAGDGTCLHCSGDRECELPSGTVHFDVYKLFSSEEQLQRVESLDDQALFLGFNHSFAVSAAEFPGIKPNSIYFAGHDRNYHIYDHRSLDLHDFDSFQRDGGLYIHDCGIFNLERQSISACYPRESKELLHKEIWVAPTPTSTRNQLRSEFFRV